MCTQRQHGLQCIYGSLKCSAELTWWNCTRKVKMYVGGKTSSWGICSVRKLLDYWEITLREKESTQIEKDSP